MTALGYGLGGFGIAEPWGSMEVGEASPEDVVAAGEYLGILEATSSAIGEEDNAIGGLYLTRLTATVAAGATSFPVETTDGWGDTGKISMDGVVYYYTGKTDTTFTGITYLRGGVATSGAVINHRIASTVVDISRTRSALERLRRAMLVEYAEGEDLSVVGRNLKVNRLPVLSGDDQFREVIKALAYNPKGTVLGITLALEALLGVGNAEVYEDLIAYPNVVFIKMDSASLLKTLAAGSTYATAHEYDALTGSSDTLALATGPLGIGGVKLLNLGELFDFTEEKPSAATYAYYPGGTPSSAFDYDGTESEATGVILTTGSHCRFSSAGGTAYYSMPDTKGARVTEKSYVEVSALVRIPSTATLSAGALLQCGGGIDDGDYRVSWGLESDLTIGLFATIGGGFIGATKQLIADTFYEVTMRKYGDERVDFLVDGELISSVDYALFTYVVTTHQIRFGVIFGAVSGMQADFKAFGAQIETSTDYWTSREGGTGDVLAANPNQFTLNGGTSYAFIAGDVTKKLRITGSVATNAQGGNNNGNWVIDSYSSGTVVELAGVEKDGALVSTVNPTRITVVGDNEAFLYPDDLGKEIVISGSAGSNDGTYVISKLLQLGTETDLSTFDSVIEERTNICEVVSATFTSELNLTWQLMPNFVNESNLDWEQSDAGSFTGTAITLRQALWGNGLYLDVFVSRVLTAQVLDADSENELIDSDPNIYEYYPFYISDPFALVKSYVDAITAAGVLPQYLIE